MLLDGSVTKQEAINDCLTYWNPNRTQTWFDMGIDIIIGKREGYYFWDMGKTAESIAIIFLGQTDTQSPQPLHLSCLKLTFGIFLPSFYTDYHTIY